MATYLIELYVPHGSPLLATNLRTILVPSDELGFCLVDAPSAAAAGELAATLGLEPERIVEALAYEPKGPDDD